MAKGCVGSFMGAFIAVMVAVVIISILAYIFVPNVLPSSPCIFDSQCQPHKVCCTWRCDSAEIKWWKCPDRLCSFLGTEEVLNLTCGCNILKCAEATAEAAEK